MQISESIQFESERLITSSLNENDAQALFEMYSDREAMKFRGSAPMTQLEDAFLMISNQRISERDLMKWRLGIRMKSDNRLIGTLLLVLNSSSRSCEIGFSFGKQYWGKGFGWETVQMVAEYLMNSMTMNGITAWCRRENTASIKIFEKAGFSETPQNDYPESILFVKKC